MVSPTGEDDDDDDDTDGSLKDMVDDIIIFISGDCECDRDDDTGSSSSESSKLLDG